ncbi:MAG: serine/threonine protein kinase [Sphaerospermopsis sp. SIO1G2]|nr:serine/threonine protein kinase [Sphaerospermopsis sp. SIO1G2]
MSGLIAAISPAQDQRHQTARRRLRILALLATGSFTLGATLTLVLPQLVAAETGDVDVTWPLFWLCVVMVVLSVALLWLLPRLSERSTSIWAHAYVLLSALLMAVTEVVVVPTDHQDISGVSGICLWIILFPLVIASRPLPTLTTALACASFMPLAYAAMPAFQGMNTGYLLEWFVPGYFCAGLSWLTSRNISRLATDLEKAQSEIRELSGYELVEKLAQGGMGEVWIARHRLLNQQAVMKCIKFTNSNFSKEDLEQRFMKEAQALATLRSPYCVRVYDYGFTEENRCYLLMEFIDGFSVQQILDAVGAFSVPRTIHILHQLSQAMVEIHAAGLLHRDLKPDNLMLSHIQGVGDMLTVIDFGLAVEVSTDERYTEADAAGTMGYLAPEILLGNGESSSASDIYSIGCIAYALLSGEELFQGAVDLAVAHIAAPVPTLPDHVPPQLIALVDRCLAKHPEERVRHVINLNRDLQELAQLYPWTEQHAQDWWRGAPDDLRHGHGHNAINGTRQTKVMAVRTAVLVESP